MTITNTLNLEDGSSASNLFMTVNIQTGTIETNGRAPVALSYWRSEADKNSGKSNVVPIVNGTKVNSCLLFFTGSEIVKVGANCTVADTFAYYKSQVAAKLLALYGWNVNL